MATSLNCTQQNKLTYIQPFLLEFVCTEPIHTHTHTHTHTKSHTHTHTHKIGRESRSKLSDLTPERWPRRFPLIVRAVAVRVDLSPVSGASIYSLSIARVFPSNWARELWSSLSLFLSLSLSIYMWIESIFFFFLISNITLLKKNYQVYRKYT